MKRRKFLQSTAAVTAATIVAPAMLISKSKCKPKSIDDFKLIDFSMVKNGGHPINLPMPTIEPGDIGVIYGNTASGKSRLLNSMFLSDPSHSYFYHHFTICCKGKDITIGSYKTLTSIIDDLASVSKFNSIYIDDFNLLDTSHSKYPLERNLYLLQKLAKGQKLKVWITLQANRIAEGYNIFPTAFSFAAVIHTEFMYGCALLKYRYGRTGIIEAVS